MSSITMPEFLSQYGKCLAQFKQLDKSQLTYKCQVDNNIITILIDISDDTYSQMFYAEEEIESLIDWQDVTITINSTTKVIDSNKI